MLGICHCNYRLIIFFILFLASSIFLTTWGRFHLSQLFPSGFIFNTHASLPGNRVLAVLSSLLLSLLLPRSLALSHPPLPARHPRSHSHWWLAHTHTHTHRLACCSALAPVTREGGAWQCCKCVWRVWRVMWLCIYYMLISCSANLSVYFHCCSECCILFNGTTVLLILRKLSYLVSPRPLFDQKYSTKSNILKCYYYNLK